MKVNTKTSLNIFLDDERHPIDSYDKYLSTIYDGFKGEYLSEDWIIVRTPSDFKKIIEKLDSEMLMFPFRISFDNDIQDQLEGYDMLKWILRYFEYRDDSKIKSFLQNCICKFHTANPVAKSRMISLYNNYKKEYLNG